MPQVLGVQPKMKFATQVSADVLAILRETARQEGRMIQSIFDDVLREYCEPQQKNKSRRHDVGGSSGLHGRVRVAYGKLSKMSRDHLATVDVLACMRSIREQKDGVRLL